MCSHYTDVAWTIPCLVVNKTEMYNAKTIPVFYNINMCSS